MKASKLQHRVTRTRVKGASCWSLGAYTGPSGSGESWLPSAAFGSSPGGQLKTRSALLMLPGFRLSEFYANVGSVWEAGGRVRHRFSRLPIPQRPERMAKMTVSFHPLLRRAARRDGRHGVTPVVPDSCDGFPMGSGCTHRGQPRYVATYWQTVAQVDKEAEYGRICPSARCPVYSRQCATADAGRSFSRVSLNCWKSTASSITGIRAAVVAVTRPAHAW